MKDKYCNYQIMNSGIFVILIFLLHSCGQTNIPPELAGHWTTQKLRISVRTKPEGNWQFTADSAIIKLNINKDHTADGNIGSAKFENAKIKTNWLLPTKMTGIAFSIECGKIGKIFENDPLDLKEVELWLAPLKGTTIEAELRFTQGLAYFPMAGGILTKRGNRVSDF
jgi:hypothetical protein